MYLFKKIESNEKAIKDYLANFELTEDKQMLSDLKGKLLKSGVDIGLEVFKIIVPGSAIAVSIIEKLINNLLIKP